MQNSGLQGYVLAHLSRRLKGELIVYQWSSVCQSTVLKHLLLRNRLANQNQILCGASLGRGSKRLFAASWSHDKYGRHAHIMVKSLENSPPESVSHDQDGRHAHIW